MARRKKTLRRPLLPPWLVLAGGLALGIGATLGWRWLNAALPEIPVAPEPALESTEEITLQEPSSFTFYTLLPNQETVPYTPPPRRRVAKPEAAPEVAVVQRYYLQAGTFRSHQAAVHKKQQIIALRKPVRIQRIVLQQRAWYRVLVGPYDDVQDMGAVRRHLQSVSIDTVALQVRD